MSFILIPTVANDAGNCHAYTCIYVGGSMCVCEIERSIKLTVTYVSVICVCYS